MYYKKFHAYPPSIDALVKTNEIRFLRKRYTDPITGKDDWKPIMFGQNKTPVAMGFFGQPLAGSTLAGTGPGGIAGASPIAGGSTFSNGGSSSGVSSIFGSNGTAGSSPGTGVGTSAGGTGAGGTGTDSGGGDTGSGAGLSSNQTFGGGGIIGFSPGSPKQSILVYKKKDHYNEWEFLYSPLADQMMQGGNAGTIGQPVGGTNSNGFGNSAGTGTGVSGGNSQGGGSGSGVPPPPPNTPQ
jgi:hypothetical protein